MDELTQNPATLKPQKPFFALATALTSPLAAALILSVLGAAFRTRFFEDVMYLFLLAKLVLIPLAIAAFITVCVALSRIRGYPKHALLLLCYLVVIVTFGFIFFPARYGPGP